MLNKSHSFYRRLLQNKGSFKENYSRIIPSETYSRHPHYLKSESEIKGYQFEQFVVSLFNPEYFTLIEWRGDKSVDDICPLTTQFPDLEFYYSTGSDDLHFVVECKYRSGFDWGAVKVAREDQLFDYREFEAISKIPVFVILGIGGYASRPDEVYSIPLREIDKGTLHSMTISPFQRKSTHERFFLNTGKLLLT